MNNPNVDKSVIDKIKKLLDHHAGCLKINSEEEAMTAMEMAKNLMKKHHLDMMMLSEKHSESDITHKQMDKCSVYSIPVWLTNIINIVNNICNCSCILEKSKQDNGYIHTNIIFVSESSEIDRVFEMYMFFKKTTYKLANLHVKRICGNYTNWRSFAEGFTSRLLERSRLVYPTTEEESDIRDIQESESDDDYDYIDPSEPDEICTDIIVSEKESNIKLYKYLKDVRDKIDEYIKHNINDVKEEQLKTVSKVLTESYESGRKQAENQNMTFADKKHMVGVNNRKTKK